MKKYLLRLQAYINRRESRRTFERDGCTYTEVTYHEGLLGEVKVDERIIHELQHVGGFDTIGPIWILSGKALLHLDFDISWLAHRCWPLNPLTAILYPFWWAWYKTERRLIWPLLVQARRRGFIALSDQAHTIDGNLYLYLLRHLWFTKRAQVIREERERQQRERQEKAMKWDRLGEEIEKYYAQT